ncbi:hypothetical protein [Rhodococcus qingshengii]|uniref:hypothetical protein n=1 Tax=Rhodococcus qingshengii TaxID=334542 RepID=UPI001C8C05A0|nr:hypothetical protein [Rhodococcus qingshengii]MBX9151979.1 hypothetical protein [Rhodococcus qingshengii]
MPESGSDRDATSMAIRRSEAKIVNQYNSKLAGCEIDGPLFRVGGKTHPINKVSAQLELGASTSSSRTTVARVVAGGAVAGVGGAVLGGAAKKVTDTSQIYLTVRTPDSQVHVKNMPTSVEHAARQFMAKLEMASKRTWPLTSEAGTKLPLAASSVRSHSQNDGAAALKGLGGAALFVGALFFHPMWVLLAVYLVFLFVLAVRDADREQKALDAIKNPRRAAAIAARKHRLGSASVTDGNKNVSTGPSIRHKVAPLKVKPGAKAPGRKPSPKLTLEKSTDANPEVPRESPNTSLQIRRGTKAPGRRATGN